MNRRDWSLVLFTCLSQASIGITWWLLVLQWVDADYTASIVTTLRAGNPVLVALLLIGVATVTSFLHLGHPRNARHTLNNLASSWLSREILAISLFSLSLVLMLVPGWFSAMLVIAALLGLALLWMMAGIYMMPTIPPWNTWYTPLSFFLTTISLGAVVLFVLGLTGETVLSEFAFRVLALCLLVAMTVEFVGALVHHGRLRNMRGGVGKPDFGQGLFYWLRILQAGLLVIGILTMGLALSAMRETSFSLWLLSCLAIVVCQAILGRHLFYASYFRIGL